MAGKDTDVMRWCTEDEENAVDYSRTPVSTLMANVMRELVVELRSRTPVTASRVI